MNKVSASLPGILAALAVVMVIVGLMVSGCMKTQDPVSATTTPGNTGTFVSGAGNGVPSGPHYDLNIIGVPKDKTADMTGDNGHRIFVPLDGNVKILLTEGPFQVLDANGTDNTPAAFQLPNPDSTNSGATLYSVYARALGKPGGKSFLVTCGLDSLGTQFCSTDTAFFVRSKGKQSFTNVSKELLYIYADINGDGIIDRVPLFDSSLQSYFWDYDNNGLKLLQLRFYDVSTTVP
jgi:hypothetical protein